MCSPERHNPPLRCSPLPTGVLPPSRVLLSLGALLSVTEPSSRVYSPLRCGPLLECSSLRCAPPLSDTILPSGALSLAARACPQVRARLSVARRPSRARLSRPSPQARAPPAGGGGASRSNCGGGAGREHGGSAGSVPALPAAAAAGPPRHRLRGLCHRPGTAARAPFGRRTLTLRRRGDCFPPCRVWGGTASRRAAAGSEGEALPALPGFLTEPPGM